MSPAAATAEAPAADVAEVSAATVAAEQPPVIAAPALAPIASPEQTGSFLDEPLSRGFEGLGKPAAAAAAAAASHGPFPVDPFGSHEDIFPPGEPAADEAASEEPAAEAAAAEGPAADEATAEEPAADEAAAGSPPPRSRWPKCLTPRLPLRPWWWPRKSPRPTHRSSRR